MRVLHDNRVLLLAALLLALPALAAPPLRSLESKHYLLHTDLDDELAHDLGRRMDAMYAEYSRRMSDFELRAEGRPLDVYLFNQKKDYSNFTGGKFANTGGVFMAGKNQLAAYLEGQRDTLRRTLQHEAFHQFVFKAVGPTMPVWMNEGMSQLFEEAIWTGEAFLMGQVPPRRLRQLQSDLRSNKLLAMKTLMSLTPEKWSGNLAADSSLGSTQYNQSWAIVHFMAYGDEGRNGAKLVTMLKQLSKGKAGDEAFRESFGENIEVFRVAFDKYILALAPTTEAAMIDRHEVLADLLAQLKDRGKAYKDVTEFRRGVEAARYKLRYTRGQVVWTAEPASYFRDSRGRAWDSDELYFEPRKMAPLPDLVFHREGERIGLRARFFDAGGKIEYEVIAEPPRNATTAGARD